MVYSRYSDVDRFMNLDVDTGYNMIISAIDKIAEDRLYMLYVSAYPHMDPEKSVSFEDIIKSSKKDNKTKSTANNHNNDKQVIMNKVENIINVFNGGDFH